MSEVSDLRSEWTLEEQLAHERELSQKRAAWEERREYEKDEAKRLKAREAMEANLANRARTYLDLTGMTPTPAMVEGWQREYVARQSRLGEEEREQGRQRSEDENYDFNAW
jgi:hypothetical protein